MRRIDGTSDSGASRDPHGVNASESPVANDRQKMPQGDPELPPSSRVAGKIPTDESEGLIRRSALPMPPTDYAGQAHVARVLNDAQNGESLTRIPAAYAKNLYYRRGFEPQAVRIPPRALLANDMHTAWIPRGYSIELEVGRGVSASARRLFVVRSGEALAELTVDGQGRVTAFTSPWSASPDDVAAAFECLSSIPLFRATAQRFDVPSMTPQARAHKLESHLLSSDGVRWEAQLPSGNLVDLKSITTAKKDGGIPLSFREIPREHWNGPLNALMHRIAGTWTLPDERKKVIDVALELVRELEPANALSILRTFSRELPRIDQDRDYAVDCTMKELSRLAPLTPDAHDDHAAILTNITAAMPAGADMPAEIREHVQRLPGEHRAGPIGESVRRGSISDESFKSRWRDSCTLPDSAQAQALPAFAEGLRHLQDEIFALAQWQAIRDAGSRLLADEPVKRMQVAGLLAQAIVKLPVSSRGEAFAQLKHDIEASHDTFDNYRARTHLSGALIGMIDALPALAGASAMSDTRSPSATEAARWIIDQIQALQISRDGSATSALFGALGKNRGSFAILLDAAQKTPDESEREAALSTLCMMCAGFSGLHGSVATLRWYRLAETVQESLPEARRAAPYRLLTMFNPDSSMPYALQAMVWAGPENVGKGPSILRFHPTEDTATIAELEA
ncbi:hypothetical protein LJR230_003951 [Trinickia sp. LjRoot230]|uniref:hypothetical protein n=1 Tax=Trinickia sp. LjRoot230 TaxID=3342288 RepID=UPI003ECCBE54